MKKYAIIVAGGKGNRFGGDIPKQFLLLNGKTVLEHSVKAFYDAFDGDITLIVVTPNQAMMTADSQSVIEDYIAAMRERYPIHTISGGILRYDSVKIGLSLAKEAGVVFVHDGARPLISPTLIRECYAAAVAFGSAVPAIPISDSIIKVQPNGEYSYEDRNLLRAVQTPQTFHTSIIQPAFEQPYLDSFTDEASVVNYYGGKTHYINGGVYNIKITHPTDIFIAEALLTALGNGK
ncbi:MAG: 2-C-methyl-D-erythritol 4-phosphate cytidylyltransferase [Chitinophagia bacterium]|nr:2-C-methyl-D-erythritol 4-phosphate cytidylyltransferase [Chitinophagia bacterium]